MISKRKDTTTLTTGEAAAAIGISCQVVGRMVDDGRIKGFKVPGSKHRRILKFEFIRYCEANKIPCNLPTTQLTLPLEE